MKLLSIEARVAKFENFLTYNGYERARKQRAVIWFSTPSKDKTAMEFLMERRTHPYKLYRSFIPQVLEVMGLPANTKVSWSRKAGCGCGCSPGFLVPGYTGRTTFVTITSDDYVEPELVVA